MPTFRPFRALRYSPGTDLQSVISPPYDVLTASDVAELAARDPANIVHVDVPAGAADRYDRAAERLTDWVARGVLVRDDAPSFTIYRMQFTDDSGSERVISGVLGGLGVYDYADGEVLPHERTTPKASTDRLDLTRATRANLSPVWGLSMASGLTAALSEPGEPMGECRFDGVTHRVERVTDPVRIEQIAGIIGRDAVLIADGHHRYGVAQTYLAEQPDTLGAQHTLTFVNELIADQLSVAAIHRLYGGVSLAELRSHLATRFDLAPATVPGPEVLGEMEASGRLLLLTRDGTAEWLSPRPGAFTDVRALDGAWLEQALSECAAEVSYQHGFGEVLAAMASGNHTAAVLIRPTSVAEIERTAREGLLMPPKSTFFSPKLRTGLVIREIGQPSVIPG